MKRKGGEVVQGCDVYIGRRMTMGGWSLPASPWANPFSVKGRGSAEAVRRYQARVTAPERAGLRAAGQDAGLLVQEGASSATGASAVPPDRRENGETAAALG